MENAIPHSAADASHPGKDFFDDPHFAPSVFVTADIAGVGGVIKQRPEDFLVEEIPLYEPVGEGEHIYMLVEKRGLSTTELVSILASHFGVRGRDVGYAGMKDKNAITRQVMSIHAPGKTPEDFPELRDQRISVLWTDLHVNKLRRGHSAGNRFSIRIRGVSVGDAPKALESMRRLAREGVPNRTGEQRFGVRMNNHIVGRLLLLGQNREALDALLGTGDGRSGLMDEEARSLYERGAYDEALRASRYLGRVEKSALRALSRGLSPSRVVRSIDSNQRFFYITAFQSAVFNRVLDERIARGELGVMLEGDVAWRHDDNACFLVDAPTLAAPSLAERVAKIEVSPTGPLWGAKMMRAGAEPGRLEEAALEATGVTMKDLVSFSHRTGDPLTGARRPLRVPLGDPDIEAGVDEHGAFIRCAFDLPAGAFATVVMREIMKPADGRIEAEGS